MMPRIGPAHGAHSRPVATPRRSDGPIRSLPGAVPFSAVSERREPQPTSGRIARSARDGKMRVRANRASSARASQRPAWLAATTQPPPIAATVATAAKVSAMPARRGRPFLRNGRSARAKTKGSTGRMHGLRIVSAPPTYARRMRSIGSGRTEGEGEAVHAIAKAGRLRAVVEEMAEVATAAAAENLGALHAEGAVGALGDRMGERLPEARPTGAAFELGRGSEERQGAAGAGEDAVPVLLEKRRGAGAFGMG